MVLQNLSEQDCLYVQLLSPYLLADQDPWPGLPKSGHFKPPVPAGWRCLPKKQVAFSLGPHSHNHHYLNFSAGIPRPDVDNQNQKKSVQGRVLFSSLFHAIIVDQKLISLDNALNILTYFCSKGALLTLPSYLPQRRNWTRASFGS